MILIIGGSGFIGTNLEHYAQEHDIEISLCSRNPISGKFSAFKCDINEITPESIKGFDYVINLVSYLMHESSEDPLESTRTNILGFQNLMTACCKAGVKRVVWLSSTAVYGNVKHVVNELNKVNPTNIYSASKVYNELSSEIYHRACGMSIFALRVPAVFGPFRKYEAMSFNDRIFYAAALGETVKITLGELRLKLSMIYSKDLAHIIYNVVFSNKKAFGIYNVGEPTSVAKIIKVLKSLNDKFSVKVVPGPKRSWGTPLIDSSKIKRELGIDYLYGIPGAFADYMQEIRRNQQTHRHQ